MLGWLSTVEVGNWPGAQHGNKDMHLPKQLKEAIHHAKLAAQTLSQLKSLDTDGERGGTLLCGKEGN
eukprot:scaffold207669_cov57-Attheya_sp.AAC.3